MLRSDIPRPSFPMVVSIRAVLQNVSSYPSRYCTSLPFLDHPIHLGSEEFESDRFNTLITRGDSLPGGLATLHTRRSPFDD